LDIAIQGDGLLEVQMADGTLSYTRDGALKIGAGWRPSWLWSTESHRQFEVAS